MPNNPALLTVNPSALFYNQITAGASIHNSSTAPAGVAPTGLNSVGLRVPDGKSLLLVGGDITMDGALRAYGGRVELGGLAAPGTVGLGVDGNNLSLSFPNLSTRASVSLINGANINVSAGGGGSITVNASNLNITGGSTLNAGIAQGLGSVGAQAGDITLNATGDISIDGNGSFVSNNVQQQAVGNSGNITLSSNSLALTGGAQLQASTFGLGNAGNVIINASQGVSLDGHYTNSDGSFGASSIISTVGGVNNAQNNVIKGNGGNIEITTGDLSLTNGAELVTSTFGQGNASNVIINATKSVSLDGDGGIGGIFSTVGGVNSAQNNVIKGNGGNIEITTGDISLTNGAQLQASTFGLGNAGNVVINATKSVSLDGSYTYSDGSFVSSGIFSNVGDVSSAQNNLAKGNSGNIQINTDQLSLTNGAQLVTSTLGQGNAGNVIINAAKSVSVDGNPTAIFSTVGTVDNNQNDVAIGNGGNIQITTGQLSLTNGAQFLANTYGQGNAGNVIINATKIVSVDNLADIFSSVGDVSSTQNNLAIGNGGNIQITTGQLSLIRRAQLGASTFGLGNAGNVLINATKSVSLDGHGDIFSTVGNVNLALDNFIKGNGGNIQITTNQLSLTNGAELLASTYGQGNAGNVLINATKSVSLDGNPTLIFSTSGSADSNAEQNSLAKGKGGNIRITTNQFSLANNTQLNASTYGQSEAGNIEVTSGSISLDQGMITAQTKSGNGGSITLTPQDLLLLRNHSLISTTAGTSSANGNGGYITINAPNGFVFATKLEDNDITANAFNGFGGVIKINALGIYNFNQRSLQDIENLLGTKDPTKINPQQLPTNDITAISLTSPALNGQVNLITPDIDPARGLVTLPRVTENPPKLVSSTCAAFNEIEGGSNFSITGRGGLPPSPDEPLTSDVVWSDTRVPTTTTQHHHKTHEAKPKPKPKPIAIIPATGWVFNGKGEVTLISTATNATASNTPFSCPAR